MTGCDRRGHGSKGSVRKRCLNCVVSCERRANSGVPHDLLTGTAKCLLIVTIQSSPRQKCRGFFVLRRPRPSKKGRRGACSLRGASQAAGTFSGRPSCDQPRKSSRREPQGGRRRQTMNSTADSLPRRPRRKTRAGLYGVYPAAVAGNLYRGVRWTASTFLSSVCSRMRAGM